jgi:hypothetical protein
MNNAKKPGLLAWQWQNYPHAHRERQNLWVHALTVPLFMAGTLAVPLALVFGAFLVPVGLFAMLLAFAAQGRGHRRESGAPLPFRGPLDVVRRVFLEQWITFPRYVLSGDFGGALRGESPAQGSSHENTPSFSGSSESRPTPERR